MKSRVIAPARQRLPCRQSPFHPQYDRTSPHCPLSRAVLYPPSRLSLGITMGFVCFLWVEVEPRLCSWQGPDGLSVRSPSKLDRDNGLRYTMCPKSLSLRSGPRSRGRRPSGGTGVSPIYCRRARCPSHPQVTMVIRSLLSATGLTGLLQSSARGYEAVHVDLLLHVLEGHEPAVKDGHRVLDANCGVGSQENVPFNGRRS